jgi:outer membrane protein OmpA-like peptidoglycan-associated protein
MAMRTLVVALAVLAWGFPASAADDPDSAAYLPGRILDLTATTVPLADPTLLDVTGFILDFRESVENIEIEESPEVIHIDVSADTLFTGIKVDFQPTAHRALQQIAAIIGQQSGAVQIDGYRLSDEVSYEDWQLVNEQANAVKQWLIVHGGIAEIRLAARGISLPRRSREEPNAPEQSLSDEGNPPQGSCMEIFLGEVGPPHGSCIEILIEKKAG